VAGYVIAVGTFALPLLFGATGLGRPRVVLTVGGALAFVCVVALVAGRAEDGSGHKLVPLWFLAGLALLLYALWCGGLWLGLRLRRAARTDPRLRLPGRG
jgi:hypothetical protein